MPGHRIVFTNGCFDILHAGHVSYLNRAKALGDILIIAVNSDASVSRLKGPSRPINPLQDRIQVLSALGCVDYLVSFDDDTPINLIRIVRPDVYVKGGDYTKETLPEALVVEQLGGAVEILPFVEYLPVTSKLSISGESIIFLLEASDQFEIFCNLFKSIAPWPLRVCKCSCCCQYH